MKPTPGRAVRSRFPLTLDHLTPIALAVLALAATAPPMRQTTAPKPRRRHGGQPTAAIAEVVVTATKRSTSLQRTPVADHRAERRRARRRPRADHPDVVNLVPGFQATGQGDHGVITMTLRGVGNDSAKTEYADPEVATFVDGVYSPRAGRRHRAAVRPRRASKCCAARKARCGAATPRSARSICRPQAGADGSTPASVEGGIGNYNRLGARGAVNVPLGETAALRIAFVHEQHDGYVDYQTAADPVAWPASAPPSSPAAATRPASSRSIRTCSSPAATSTAPRTRARCACRCCGSRSPAMTLEHRLRKIRRPRHADR